MSAEFERMIAEAERQPFSGWDFSFTKGRYIQGRLSWDFASDVRGMIRQARSVLDLGTGGGELLASLGPLPPLACATEGYAPNLRVALRALAPLGADVVDTYSEDNGTERQEGALPFRENSFDLVMDRHESYVPGEVARVLERGGVFATQQVGPGDDRELRDFFGEGLGARGPSGKNWDLQRAVSEIESVGMRVTFKRAESVPSRFLDIGALAFHLKAIPWEVPGFSVKKYRSRLLEAHELILEEGGFDVTTSRFYVRAKKE